MDAIKPETQRILDRMAKAFMQPVIEQGDAWDCETEDGVGFVVPSDVPALQMSSAFPDRFVIEVSEGDDIDDENTGMELRILSELSQYAGGDVSPHERAAKATVRRNVWLCRMSAPGYMDCTDWEIHESAQSAAESLIENHSTEDESEGSVED